MRRLNSAVYDDGTGPTCDDDVGRIFMCCHPALDLSARVPLALRWVCGLSTGQIASMLLVPDSTIAQRVAQANRKIRQGAIPLRLPPSLELGRRLPDVLRVIYLVFTAGHRASTGGSLISAALCDRAIHLARDLRARLPGEPEVTGLLALILLTDARRAARLDGAGEPVLLADQDRGCWNHAAISEGIALLDEALHARRPGTYQLQAAIAACHSSAPTAAATEWREIAGLYAELIRYEPTPVVEANRAIAVAMAEGPGAGLVILDVLLTDPQLARWPQLHLGRADLLARLGRTADAVEAYRRALDLEPPVAERAFIQRRIRELLQDPASGRGSCVRSGP